MGDRLKQNEFVNKIENMSESELEKFVVEINNELPMHPSKNFDSAKYGFGYDFLRNHLSEVGYCYDSKICKFKKGVKEKKMKTENKNIDIAKESGFDDLNVLQISKDKKAKELYEQKMQIYIKKSTYERLNKYKDMTPLRDCQFYDELFNIALNRIEKMLEEENNES